MGSLKPRPTFSPHSSRYWTSSRRASVARAHVVVLMGVPTENAIQRFSFECNIVTIGSGGWDVQVALPRMSLISKAFAPDRIIGRDIHQISFCGNAFDHASHGIRRTCRT